MLTSLHYRLMSHPEIGPRLLFADDPEAELVKIMAERAAAGSPDREEGDGPCQLHRHGAEQPM